MRTIQEVAKEFQGYLKEFGTDGSTKVTCTDNAPDWVREACRNAHGDMLPDDWRYRFIKECIDQFADS